MQCEGLYSYWTLWTSELIKKLTENEPWTYCMNIEFPGLLVDETLERRTALVEEALKSLPMPMQTLLKALKHLKLKMESHSLAHASNIESNYSSQAIIATKKICDILGTAKKLRNSPVSRLDALVKEEMKEESYVKYLNNIESEASMLRQKLFELTDSSRVYAHRSIALEPIVKKSLKAIEDSEQFRNRLVHLAEGPLSSLFEISEPVEDQPSEDPLTIIDVPKLNAEKIKEVEDLLNKNQEKLKKLRYISDKIYSECSSDAIKINYDAIESIKKICLKKPEVEKYSIPTELKNADNSLQKEISMVLGTLTMDKSALDIVLRSIKSDCHALRIATIEELRSSMYKTLKEIQGLYSCASLSFIKTLDKD